MKRGLVEWDPGELSAATLAGRVARCQAVLADEGLDAAIFYTSVAQPGLVRYLTHFLPYWNEGVLVLPRAGEPTLFVALSNRVFPWIKGSSTLQDVRASRNLGADAARLLVERGAGRVGLADRGSIPYRVVEALQTHFGSAGSPAPRGATGNGQVVDAAAIAASIRLAADADELRLRARAAAIAAGALTETGDAVQGRTESALAGQLDRAMRLAAAEDTLVLVGPAGRWPGLPTGQPLPLRAHVVLQVEYKGHWVMMGRTLPPPAVDAPAPHAGEALAAPGARPSSPADRGAATAWATAWQARLQTLCRPGRGVAAIIADAYAHDGTDIYLYRSGRGAPFTALGEDEQVAVGDIVAVLALSPVDGGDLYGETFAVAADGPRPLA